MKPWQKRLLTAIVGGALTAISAAIMDHNRFNLRDGLGDELIIGAEGALLGLAGLFVKPPGK